MKVIKKLVNYKKRVDLKLTELLNHHNYVVKFACSFGEHAFKLTLELSAVLTSVECQTEIGIWEMCSAAINNQHFILI